MNKSTLNMIPPILNHLGVCFMQNRLLDSKFTFFSHNFQNYKINNNLFL